MGVSGQRGDISFSHDPETDNDNAVQKINNNPPPRVSRYLTQVWCFLFVFLPFLSLIRFHVFSFLFRLFFFFS